MNIVDVGLWGEDQELELKPERTQIRFAQGLACWLKVARACQLEVLHASPYLQDGNTRKWSSSELNFTQLLPPFDLKNYLIMVY